MHLTPEELALLPTDEDVAFYQEHGFYKSKRIFTAEELAVAIAGSERSRFGVRQSTMQLSDHLQWVMTFVDALHRCNR